MFAVPKIVKNVYRDSALEGELKSLSLTTTAGSGDCVIGGSGDTPCCLCGSGSGDYAKKYNPENQTCCVDSDGDGRIADIEDGKCCGTNDPIAFDPENQTCCVDDDGFREVSDPSYRIKNGKCCGTGTSRLEPFDPTRNTCCVGPIGFGFVVFTKSPGKCCGIYSDGHPAFPDAFDPDERTCCISTNGRGSVSRDGTNLDCCGTNWSTPYDPSNQICCAGWDGNGWTAYRKTPPWKCCSSRDLTSFIPIDTSNSICCTNSSGPYTMPLGRSCNGRDRRGYILSSDGRDSDKGRLNDNSKGTDPDEGRDNDNCDYEEEE